MSANPAAKDPMPRTTQPNGYRVLIIDDNPAIHEDIRKILIPTARRDDLLDQMSSELFGDVAPKADFSMVFHADSALQGKEGYEMVKAKVAAGEPYMLAFVDVRMPPGWDGIETIEHLWNADPSLQIVLCTAYSDHSWKEISQRLPRLDGWLVLKKPFDTIEVLQSAHSLASKWMLGEQLRHEFQDLEGIVADRTKELKLINEKLMHEITERKAAETNLKHLATHDALTGLSNRLLLRDRLDLAVARGRRFKTPTALMMLDLDGFKEVNDSLGHEAGDALLKTMASRLKKAARECDTVSRFGGDEFVILLTDLANEEDTRVVAERVLASVAEPVAFGGQTLSVTTSIGIAVFPRDGEDAETLLKCADIAMYEAKAGGRNGFRHYIAGTAVKLTERMALREDLKRAVENDELELKYQPLIDLKDETIVGIEALLRWNHPIHGVIDPMRFLPNAEESGQIGSIGKWVVEKACRQTMFWRAKGLRPVPISVNLTAAELEREDLASMIEGVLNVVGLDPTGLQIEVTETAATRNLELSERNLVTLSNMGVGIIIDDFGAGTSSLRRLKRLPVDAIKIDRLFIKNIADDPRDAAIVAAVVSLARSLGIRVIAAGIETRAQLEFLRGLRWQVPSELQCQAGQGFLFSRPISPLEIERLLGEGHVGESDAPRNKDGR
jgi:diguanylate cyclase